MGSADEGAQRAFRAVLAVCAEGGAEVVLSVNGSVSSFNDLHFSFPAWRSFGLTVRKGMLPINEGNAAEDMRQAALWTSRVAAAVLALLPVEIDEEEPGASGELSGFPEGAKTTISVNRYERDRRNRAAALAIHGYICKACDLDMEARYGPSAAGLIEVHHVTPVSELGEGYIIDPKADLLPLCPNCHAVTHRRIPPWTIDDLRKMLGSKDGL
jgi:5-methylcytosine-specific restriction protein A